MSVAQTSEQDDTIRADHGQELGAAARLGDKGRLMDFEKGIVGWDSLDDPQNPMYVYTSLGNYGTRRF